MSSSYDEAVATLYRAAHESFVAERQRLAHELKASGDKLTAARVAKLPRPSISAWAVNQLWWQAEEAFQELFESAAQLRAGKLTASAAHRQALAKLSARARKLLADGGHAASEGTLRRVEMTLAGLAASGGFEPEVAGTLTKDRDPPGFEAFGIGGPSEPESEPAETKHVALVEAQRLRQEAEAERKRAADVRAKRQAAQRALETALHTAQSELSVREREHQRLTKELATAAREAEKARDAVKTAEAQIAALKAED